MDSTSVELQLAELGIRLAEAAARNTAIAVTTQIRAIKAKKNDRETITELEAIINTLLSEKTELIGIAESYKQELIARQITPEQITYITEKFIPRLQELIEQALSNTAIANTANVDQFMDIIKSSLSVEILTVLQLIGFNYKKAIGEPLTLWMQKLITSKIPADPQVDLELKRLPMLLSNEAYRLAQNQEASERLEHLRDKGLI